MYVSHFNFNAPPFRQLTRADRTYFADYHRDVCALLQAKSLQSGGMGVFSEDDKLLQSLHSTVSATSPYSLTISAFPALSDDELRHKLGGEALQGKTTLAAIDTLIAAWQAQSPGIKPSAPLLIVISAMECALPCSAKLLATLITRAKERAFPLTVLLTGSAERSIASELTGLMHTRITLRPLSGRECQHYIAAQIGEQGGDLSLFPRPLTRRLHLLTKGNVSRINQTAHLALLAAWSERASQVTAHHLRLACAETRPLRRKSGFVFILAALTIAAGLMAGWYVPESLIARSPLPVPASWTQTISHPAVPETPSIERLVISPADAMHQLYKMWGYDTSAEEALCQNAYRAALACKSGEASLETLEHEGYPWIAELRTGNHMNYAVVARIEEKSLDLRLGNQTWQASRQWYQQHATGHYTQLHHLTPEGKKMISAASGSQDIRWLDQMLSTALQNRELHAKGWSAELMQRTREFQQRCGLHVDGIAGEETLKQLMRSARMTPTVIASDEGIPQNREKS